MRADAILAAAALPPGGPAHVERTLRIRDCASFGLPGHVRIAVRTPAENRRLVQAIEEVRC